MTRIKMCIVLCSILVCLLGCGQESPIQETENSTNTDVIEDTVLLSDVQPPEFMKRFAIMYYGDNSADVMWGWAENRITEIFFWPKSSYPGFGYTVILQYDYFDGSDSITLCTKYGEYTYDLAYKVDVFQESGTLFRRDTGEDLNRLSPFDEQLLIYNSTTNIAYCFNLKRGTKIVIE